MYEKMIKMLTKQFDEKRFCFVLHGLSNSGKTKIMEVLKPLFHTYSFFENNGEFCEKMITPEHEY